jgi:DNA-binding XRE family transcriptional regulator
MDIHEAGLALDLPDLIFETRAGAGMNQAQLAEAMGTTHEAVAAWEDGPRCPVSTCCNGWRRYAASGCISASTSTDLPSQSALSGE